MIRPLANFAEIVPIIDLMERAHARSKHALAGSVDRQEARRVLTQCNQRCGSMKEGGTLLNVATVGDRIAGFMLSSLGRVYIVGNRLVAYDEMLYIEPDADSMDCWRLIKAHCAWGDANPLVSKIMLQMTDFIEGEHLDTLRRLYAHLGFKEEGAMFARLK